MLLKRSLMLLDPTPSDGGGGNTIPQGTSAAPVAPVAPSQPRTLSPKSVGVETPAKALPEASKGFQFKIEDPSLLSDEDGSLMPEIKTDKPNTVPPKAETPLDVANQLLAEKPKVEEKTPKVEPAPAKAEPAVSKTEEVVPKGPLVPKSKVAAQEFDYSGYSQEEASALKQMSTGARDFTIKILKERKELASQTGGTYLQHPDAYVLDPQFNALNEDVSYAEKEAMHWQEQLIKAQNGEKWRPVEKWDAKGNPVLGAEQMPTVQAIEQMRMYMNKCNIFADNKRNELQMFAHNYKQRIQADTNAIQSERARRFGWVADPKIMESTLVVEDGSEQTVAQVRNTLINLFPPYMRKETGVQVAADLFAAFQIIQQELREAKTTDAVVQQKVADTVRAEPTTTRGGGAGQTPGKVVNGVKEFSLNGVALGIH